MTSHSCETLRDASEDGHVECIRRLLDNGANIHAFFDEYIDQIQ
jgi:hypothetical protein